MEQEFPLFFLKSRPHLSHISSSAFKSVFACEGWTNYISKYLPKNTANAIIEYNLDGFIKDLWFNSCKCFVNKMNGFVETECTLTLGKLLDAYNRNIRYYHTCNHLKDCLIKYFAFMNNDDGCHVVNHYDIMALFWHDAVYFPGSKDNEERSAAMCRTFLKSIGVLDADIDEVCKKILETKSNVNPVDGSYVKDIDLSILGADPADYKKYVEQIECEFESISKEKFNEGRAKWLQETLSTRIFSTDLLGLKYENKARANLEAELKERLS
jgi:predicted metal-dependent HD superfamily phosphohydrolase